MAAAKLIEDNHRELLAQAIVNELHSWPESCRDLFTAVHYYGKSAQDVAHSLGLNVRQVNEILVECETKLRLALAVFRNTQQESTPDCNQEFSHFFLVS